MVELAQLKKEEREKTALDTLRQSSEVERTAETLGGWGIEFPYDPLYGCVQRCGGW